MTGRPPPPGRDPFPDRPRTDWACVAVWSAIIAYTLAATAVAVVAIYRWVR